MRARSLVRITCAIFLLATVLRADDDRDRQRNRRRSDDSPQAEFILCAPTDRVPAIARRHGLTIVRPVDVHAHGIFLVRGPVPRQHHDAIHGDVLDVYAHQLMDEVRADPDVLHFDVNGSSVITEIGASPQLNASTVEILDSLSHTVTGYFGTQVWTGYVSQPALGVIQLVQAQQIADGRGIVVAVIDTGVDPHHPALTGSLVDGYDFTRDLAGAGSEWTDLDASTVEILDSASPPVADPGVSMPVNSSTVALVDQTTASRIDLSQLPHAFGHGTMVAGLVHVVAPAAKIMPLKVFDADGNSTIFDIERAIYYAVDHGAKVINMSFSSADASAEVTHAIDYAGAHGVICLASAGNSGRSDVVFPAGYRNVMAIGSTTLTDERSTFTNFGDHLVQFAAPGETLITLYPGGLYSAVAGTSFSTAMMSGAAALLSQRVPLLDQRLAGRYFDDGVLRRREWELGNGRVNLYETLRLHGSAGTPVTPPAPLPDTTAPTVTLTAPSAGAQVTGSFELSATASDDVGVAGVVFRLDGIVIGGAPTAPFVVGWDSLGTASGAHVLTATAFDAAGNEATSSVGVTVTNDTAAPDVTVTSPSSGARVTGTVTVSAAASDNIAVAGVQFTLDGENLGAERTAAPYDVAWNSGSVRNGAHLLGAIARDAVGNQRSASVTITVANDTTAPVVAVTSPADGALVAGTIPFAASAADEVGVVGLQLMVDGVNLGAERQAPPYDVMWNSGSAANGVHVLAAVGRDAAGNQRSASVTITVANDLTAPAIALTSPAGGTTSVTGTITLASDASDDVGVAGVQFTIDGVNAGAELSAPPYEIAWNSGSVANGAHQIAAIARDAAGNQRSASVSVTVLNDTTAPDLAMIAPVEDGATVAATITIAASASDDVGVLGVQFAIDGIDVGAEIAAAPYQMEWDTAGAADGAHVVTAVARDAAGNRRTVTVNVIIDNGVR
jgi:hypothetical protein